MTLEIWIVILAVFAAVVLLRLGRHRYTRRQRVVMLALMVGLGLSYIRGMPTSGNDLALELSCLGVGVAFGFPMLFVTSMEKDAESGEIWVRAGAAYLALWLVLLGGRVFFAYSATGWAHRSIGRFFITNNLSFNSISPAFVLMTIGSVLVFTIGQAVRATTLDNAPLLAHHEPSHQQTDAAT